MSWGSRRPGDKPPPKAPTLFNNEHPGPQHRCELCNSFGYIDIVISTERGIYTRASTCPCALGRHYQERSEVRGAPMTRFKDVPDHATLKEATTWREILAFNRLRESHLRREAGLNWFDWDEGVWKNADGDVITNERERPLEPKMREIEADLKRQLGHLVHGKPETRARADTVTTPLAAPPARVAQKTKPTERKERNAGADEADDLVL